MTESIFGKLMAEGIETKRHEPLSVHTTFRIGGAAQVFCCPRTVTELVCALELCRENDVRTYLLGNGSNTLFSDAGFSGVVICLMNLKGKPTFSEEGEYTLLTVSAGSLLSSICQAAQKKGLSGLEFAYGIPGTLGGAVYMNAGAYGGEMKDVLVRVSYLDQNFRLCSAETDAL